MKSILSILVIAFIVIGFMAIVFNLGEEVGRNNIIAELQRNQIKKDSIAYCNYKKQKIELAMSMYKYGYFFGILKHSIYGQEAFNIFKKDSINARKTIE